MPCTTCGSLLVRENENSLCPKCNKIQLLDRYTTCKVLQKNLEEVEDVLIGLIKNRVDKNKLLDGLTWEREKFSRGFFQTYKGFDMTKFLTLNLLMFKLMKESFQGSRSPDDEEVKDIIKAFSKYVSMKNNFLLFKNGFAEALKDGTKIRTIPNERYFPIIRSYEDNLIMIESIATEKLKHFKRLFDLIFKGGPRGYLSFTPNEYVEHFYQTINQFYCALLRNELYDEVFGLLKKYNEISLTPGKLMDFTNSYQLYPGTLSFTSVDEFAIRAKKHFNMKDDDIKQLLLFSEKNTSIFPMFISIDDTVYISHRTAYLIYILLHAIFYKELFDKETEKRSKEFEKNEVKKEFESIGWTYLTSLKDKKQPSIEIDGIATFKKEMLVIECKGWRSIRPFREYANIQKYIIRDIKGIVDGKKFTGEIPEKIPSLDEKLCLVKDNMSIWGFNPSGYDKINGIIVVRGFPPIEEYKGIRILSINDIETMFDRNRNA